LAKNLPILEVLHVFVVKKWADVLSTTFRSTWWGFSLTFSIDTTVRATQQFNDNYDLFKDINSYQPKRSMGQNPKKKMKNP
jgi:hypothetical protein